MSILFWFLIHVGALQPCATDDSTNCYWDAQHQGNGQGQSYVDLGGWDWGVDFS